MGKKLAHLEIMMISTTKKEDKEMIDELMLHPEFQTIIPPLSYEEYQQLEDNILADGEVLVPILTWNGYIVDGHNRYRIIKKHPELKYSTREMDFDNEYAAMVWICDNQLGRRNLTDMQRRLVISRRYEAEKQAHGGQERFSGVRSMDSQNDGYKSTRERLAAELGVSPRTISNAAAFTRGLDAAEEVVPGITRAILSDEITVTNSEIMAIAKAAPEERAELVAELSLPPKERRERRKQREALKEAAAERESQPMTAKRLFELFVTDVNTAIGTFESNLTKCGGVFTDRSHKAQLDGIIEMLEDYARKLRSEQNYD